MRIPRLTHLTLPPVWHTSCDFFRIEKMVKRMRPYLSFFCFFSKLNKKLAWMFRSQIILIVVVLNKHADTFPRPKVVVYSCSKVVKKRFTPVYNPRKMAVFFSLLRQPLRPKKGRMLYPSWSFVHLQIQHLLSITNQPSYQFFLCGSLEANANGQVVADPMKFISGVKMENSLGCFQAWLLVGLYLRKEVTEPVPS